MADEIIITESSRRKLEQELSQLRGARRRELAEALRAARAFGDLTENFEYHAARREQAIVNGRIKEIERLLERAKVVPDDAAAGTSTARLGHVVTVLDVETGEEWEFTLVDPVQADPLEDRISVQSPTGQAVLGKAVGDEVTVTTPGGAARYRILAIRS